LKQLGLVKNETHEDIEKSRCTVRGHIAQGRNVQGRIILVPPKHVPMHLEIIYLLISWTHMARRGILYVLPGDDGGALAVIHQFRVRIRPLP
jgi:hypothetical protein